MRQVNIVSIIIFRNRSGPHRGREVGYKPLDVLQIEQRNSYLKKH